MFFDICHLSAVRNYNNQLSVLATPDEADAGHYSGCATEEQYQDVKHAHINNSEPESLLMPIVIVPIKPDVGYGIKDRN